MAIVTVYENIIFIEGEHPRAIKKQRAQVRVGGFGAQLKNLNDLKKTMADNARMNGCNCVVNFSYGQKAAVLAIDDVAFVGEGYYALLSQQDYMSIITQVKR